MQSLNPQSTVKVAGHPVHPMLVPFPIAFLVATLFCDLAFWLSGKPSWTTAAMWLLGAAIVMAALAALAGLTDFLGDAWIRALNAAWLHLGGNAVAVVLSVINSTSGINKALRPRPSRGVWPSPAWWCSSSWSPDGSAGRWSTTIASALLTRRKPLAQHPRRVGRARRFDVYM